MLKSSVRSLIIVGSSLAIRCFFSDGVELISKKGVVAHLEGPREVRTPKQLAKYHTVSTGIHRQACSKHFEYFEKLSECLRSLSEGSLLSLVMVCKTVGNCKTHF